MSHSTTPESPTQLVWKPQIKHIYFSQGGEKKGWGDYVAKTAAFSRNWTYRAQNKFREQMKAKIHYVIIKVTIKLYPYKVYSNPPLNLTEIHTKLKLN